jgi:hypothetical protein
MAGKKPYIKLLQQANLIERKDFEKALDLLEECLSIIKNAKDPKFAFDEKTIKRRIGYLNKKMRNAEGEYDEEEIAKNEAKQAQKDEKIVKHRLKALHTNEIDQIWEFYFLHRYKHPTPEEFYGDDNAKNFIQQMLQQVNDIYDKIDSTKVFTEAHPGDTKLYFIGGLEGSFSDSDILSRHFQSKIFESQATENPLRLVFLGNYTGNNPMSLHNILYLICFNLAYPAEVLLLRGANEDRTILEKSVFAEQVLKNFDQDLLNDFYLFFSKLPVAYNVKSQYKNVIASSGGLPIEYNKPEESIEVDSIKLRNKSNLYKNIDTLSKQFILNQPSNKLGEGTTHKKLDNGAYIFSEAIFKKFMEKNLIELYVNSCSFLKKGHKTFWDNQLISICSTSELEGKLGKGKILEVLYPSDPEYDEYEYDDEDEETEEEEEEDEEEDDEEYEDEEEEEEVDPNQVFVNILDINSF